MKRITTLLFIFFSLSISAQELISNIQSEGNLQRYRLLEIDDNPYILAFDALDSIKVYQVQQDGYTLMRTHYMIGSYKEYFYRVFKDWLLLEGAQDAFAINILTGEEKVFEAPEGFISNSWRIYKEYVVLRQSPIDFSEYNYHLLNKELDIIDTDEWYRYMRKATNDFAVVEKTEGDDRVLYRGDITTHELWEVARFQEGEYFALSDNQIYGYRDNKVQLINIADGNVEDLHTLTFVPTRQEINTLSNYFFFSAYNNSDEEVTVVYSKASNQVRIWPFHVSDFLSKSPEDKFIFDHPTEYDSANIYTFESDEMITIPAYNINQSIIIDGRYIVNRVIFDVEIYDLELNTATIAEGGWEWWPSTRYWEAMKAGDKAHIFVETPDEKVNDLTVFDIPNSSFSSSALPAVQRGLNNYTQIFKLGEDVIVGSDEDIFNVTEDGMIQLSEAPILESSYQPFSTKGNQLFWAEDQDSLVYFYSFEDGQKYLEAIFGTGTSPIDPDNFWVRSFTNGNNTILIYGRQGFEDKYILLNKETGSVINVDDIPYSLINSAKYNKDYFYTISDKLYAVDETGQINIVDISLPQLLFGGYVIHEGDLYVVGNDGLYIVDGLEATKILDHGTPTLFGDFDYVAGNLVYNLDDQSFMYKDGIWNNWTKLEDVWYTNFDDEYLQVVKSTGTNLTETQLFHIEDNEYIDLPLEIKDRRIISRFSYFDNQYIISYVGSLPTYDVKIHEVSEDFSTAEEIHNFESVGRGLSAHFEEFDNEGFLYIGNKLFLMNEDLEFIQLEGVFGDPENVTAVEKDGYFYFIAFHPELGRQVWSVQAFSERVSVSDLQKMYLKVYPNPTEQMLFISPENNITKGKYRIFSASGQIIEYGRISRTDGIDVSQLETGFYYLKYYDEEKLIFTAPFVKR